MESEPLKPELTKQQLIQQNRNLKEQLTEFKQLYGQLQTKYTRLAQKYRQKLKKQKKHGLIINSAVTVRQQILEPDKLRDSFTTYFDLISNESSLSRNSNSRAVSQLQQKQQVNQQEWLQELQVRQVCQNREIKQCISDKLKTEQGYENDCLIELQPITNTTQQNKQYEFQSVKQQEVDFFADHESSEEGFNLIESCFIMQKQKSLSVSQSLKFCYPQKPDKKMKQVYQMLIDYSFFGWGLAQIVDDQFGSRINEIQYGSLFQQMFYVFEDLSLQQENYVILKKMHKMKKRYVHAIIKPQIIEYDGKTYETQLLFGFTSFFPIRPAFQDILKAIMQQMKYLQILNKDSEPVENAAKYRLISEIMIKLTDLKVRDFPITGSINTGVCTIELRLQSAEQIEELDVCSLNMSSCRFDDWKISLIIHAILTEKHVLLVASNRSILTEIFELIRLAIFPFNWLFPIVYNISEQFYPYLQSPLPIIAGCIGFIQKKLPQHEFIVITVDRDFNLSQSQLSRQQLFKSAELKQLKEYSQNIKYLENSLRKFSDKKGKVLRTYVNKLKKLIENGQLINEQLSQFHIDFLQTQMASYYKQKFVDNQSVKIRSI